MNALNDRADAFKGAPRRTSTTQRLRERLHTQQKVIAVVVLLVLAAGALAVGGWPGERATTLGTGLAGVEAERATPIGEGEASYYGPGLAGNPTASGETFDPEKLTAAHRTLPLGTRVRVTNLRNDKSVVVRVNDRGPYAKRRVIDLSEAAARRIEMLRRGKARVRLEVLE